MGKRLEAIIELRGLLEKTAFVQVPPHPSNQPPADPAMAQQGMQGAPPPVDPAMAQQGMQGAPPTADPAMAQQGAQSVPPEVAAILDKAIGRIEEIGNGVAQFQQQIDQRISSLEQEYHAEKSQRDERKKLIGTLLPAMAG